jgi:hypothetical protein
MRHSTQITLKQNTAHKTTQTKDTLHTANYSCVARLKILVILDIFLYFSNKSEYGDRLYCRNFNLFYAYAGSSKHKEHTFCGTCDDCM